MENHPESKSILLLAANPKGTGSLRLQEEEREIKERLRLAGYGKTPINSAVATRPRDVQQAMLDFKPQIVHFSGHGDGEDGLVFEDVAGNPQLIDAAALANLFKLFSESVECVVLNACYSQFQAEAIAQHIDYVIGMGRAIGDRSAIDFSVGFYTALGAGRTIEFAYNLGCNAIQLGGHREHTTPILIAKKLGLADEPLAARPLSPYNSAKHPDRLEQQAADKPEVRESNLSSPSLANKPFGLNKKVVLSLLSIPAVLLSGALVNQAFNSPLNLLPSPSTSSGVASIADSGTTPEPAPTPNKTYLIGEWSVEEACPDQDWKSRTTVTFLSNNSLTSQADVSIVGVEDGKAIEIIWLLVASGVWELNGDRLILTVSDLKSRLQNVKVDGSIVDTAQLNQDWLNQVQNIFQEIIPQNIATESLIVELNAEKMILQASGSACPQISEYVKASR